MPKPDVLDDDAHTGARRCPDCHGTTKCWACSGYNPGDDLGSGCTECDGWGNCQSCYEGWGDDD
jgi:hypothetical protein